MYKSRLQSYGVGVVLRFSLQTMPVAQTSDGWKTGCSDHHNCVRSNQYC